MNLSVSCQQVALGTPNGRCVVKASTRDLRNGSTNEVNLEDENMNNCEVEQSRQTYFVFDCSILQGLATGTTRDPLSILFEILSAIGGVKTF